jgi:hypothetical protein
VSARRAAIDHEPLIERLVADLAPVEPPLASGVVFAAWAVLGGSLVVGLALALGPFRPGAFGQLAAAPRFAVECAAGLAAGAAALWAALGLAVPGSGPRRRRVGLALAPALVWGALYGYGLHDPSLPPSMAGKREGCLLEGLAYGLAVLALVLWLLRRHVVLERRWTAALLGVAAAALPALVMQLACMYDPQHILLHHLSAVPVLALAAWLLGGRLLRSV